MLAPDRSAEVGALLQEGIGAARAGDKESARQKIQRVTELEPNNEAAWLWLASLYSEPNVSAYCLQRAVAINPNNEKAVKALTKLQQQIVASQNAALHPDAISGQGPVVSGQYFEASEGSLRTDPQQSTGDHLDFEELKRRGIVAGKGGRREEARAYLMAATEQNDGDAETWLWLSTVLDDPEDKQIALENVLILDPLNEVAANLVKENSVALERRRAPGPLAQVTSNSGALDAGSMQWSNSGNLGGFSGATSGPLASGPLASPAGAGGSGPLNQSSLFASTASAASQAKGSVIHQGDFIAYRYHVMGSVQGAAGIEYTTNEVGTRRFYTLRPQKCEVADLKKVRAQYVVHQGVPYTVVAIGTKDITLRSFIDTVGCMPAELAVNYAQSMLKRLTALHTKGPVLSAKKRITPETVTFDGEGELLLDAPGQRSEPSDNSSQTFLPPEVVSSGAPAPTSDIYAVGALLFFMLTGSPPPEPHLVPRKQGDAVVPPQFAGYSGVPDQLVKVLATAMQPNPVERYSSAQEMSQALTATGIGKKPSSSGGAKVPILVVGVAIVALLAVTYFIVSGTLQNLKLPFSGGADQSQAVVVVPVATAAPVPTVVPAPSLALAKVSAHTVDTRRFPTDSLFFSALDAEGQPIEGITIDNVKVTDNGNNAKTLQLTELRNTTDPVSIIFAIDNSMLMAGRPLDDAKTAIHLLVDRMPAGDQMALMTFGGQLRYRVDYTVSKTEFLSAVDSIQASGKPDILPGIILAADRTVSQPQGGYTAMLVITNSPLPRGTAVLQAATKAANLANLPVFFVGLEKENYTADAANKLASSTGGLAVLADRPEAGGAWDAIQEVDAQLHNVYKLTYDSGSLDAKSQHTVVVTVTANGATQTDTRQYVVLNP